MRSLSDVIDGLQTEPVINRRQLCPGNYVKKDGEIGLVLGDDDTTYGQLLPADANEVVVLVIRHQVPRQVSWSLAGLGQIIFAKNQPTN